MCVHAWASRYGGLIHYLSGGLDSAIVLAALGTAKRRTPVVTLNYFSPGTDGDERTYARAAARSASYELIEQQRSTELDLREMLTAYRTAQPVSYFVRLEASKHEAALANRTGADGLFSGDGGDALFFRSPVVWTAIDYARDHGLVPSSLEIALNAACLDDRSVWPVLRDMWRYGVRRKQLHSLTEHRSDWGAVSAEVADRVTRRGDFTHPWFECSAAVAPGKLRQMFLLAFAPDFYDPFTRGELPERVCPLLSQPLVELCLRIPTYVLAPGPQDRMLARNAFAADLPDEILYRRAKGGLVRHVGQILEANRAFLAELLLEGVLVSRGLLDRKKVADTLSTTPSREKCSAPEIFDYAGIESWARSWTSSC
jgi:asparagine synthase (glutamine-hydrolysing)